MLDFSKVSELAGCSVFKYILTSQALQKQAEDSLSLVMVEIGGKVRQQSLCAIFQKDE